MKKSELFEAVLALMLILLAFTLCLAILSGSSVSERWAISGPVAHTGFWAYDNVFAPGNGVLYTVDGSSVYAIGEDGKIIWDLAIPDKYKINGKNEKWTGMAAAVDGSGFYIIVGPGNEPERGELMAIAPLTFKRDDYNRVRPGLRVMDGRIYLYHYHNQIILDANGSIVCNLNDIYNQAGVDDSGNMYVFCGGNGSLEALDRDGKLLWRHSSGDYNVSITGGWNNVIDQPYYRNGTLYVWLTNGVMALDTSGNKLWTKFYEDQSTYPDFKAPFDDRDNLYLWHYNYNADDSNGTYPGSYLSMVRPDGSEVVGPRHTYNSLQGVVGVSDGLYYHVQRVVPGEINDWLNADYYKDPATLEFILKQAGENWNNSRRLDQLDTYMVQAVDIPTDRVRWNTTLPAFPAHIVTFDASNIGLIMPPYFDLSYAGNENQARPDAWYKDNRVPDGTEAIGSWVDLDFLPGKNVTYVSQWAINYEVPTFYGRSQGAYSGGIYALDKDGKLLWAKPTGARVTDMKEVNGTIYYGTDDGRLFATKVNLAAGFALTAVFYLFMRFFMAGAVTRARSRLDSNENRNVVLKFIADNPGSGLYDISKGLGLNMGTVRYHLLILNINHRIVSFRADGKHVRYFTNSGSYRPDERSIISLMRRDAMRKTLGVLLKSPGLSNRELSRELNMLDSATARYMKELVERGIVENDPNSESRTSYMIKSEYREKIAFLLERVDGTVCI
jgi:predicted transcriptional regulator